MAEAPAPRENFAPRFENAEATRENREAREEFGAAEAARARASEQNWRAAAGALAGSFSGFFDGSGDLVEEEFRDAATALLRENFEPRLVGAALSLVRPVEPDFPAVPGADPRAGLEIWADRLAAAASKSDHEKLQKNPTAAEIFARSGAVFVRGFLQKNGAAVAPGMAGQIAAVAATRAAGGAGEIPAISQPAGE